MKKEEYVTPQLELIVISSRDVITLSTGDTDEAEA